MKLYIFLAHTIGGLTGSATYVRNKMKWLEQKGWKVIIFDGTANNSPIVIEEFKQFESNRIKELYFTPSLFWKNNIRMVLNKMTSKIPHSDLVVIESNNPNLAMWGELFASKLKAKHIIYTLGEKEIVRSDKEFDFLHYKALNKELFCIDSKAVVHLFGKYRYNIDPENLYWNASNRAPIEYYKFLPIDCLNKEGIYIGYLGREKSYLNKVIEGIVKFALNHIDKKVSIVLLGVKALPNEYISKLTSVSNLKYFCIEAQPIIPKQFFDLCDIVIANAACARMSFEQGAKVISMNVRTNKPLGILGYTTNEISFESQCYKDERELCVLLEDVLIYNSSKYNEPKIELPHITKGYEYQEVFAYDVVNKPYDVLSINPPNNIREIIKSVLLNLGFVDVISHYRYHRTRT